MRYALCALHSAPCSLPENYMKEYTIFPLVVGINETDQGVMTYLRDYGKRIYLPIYVFYLSGGDKNILDDNKIIELDGDANILEGIEVILSPGHSVGGQSVAVNTAEGQAIITGFCCNDKNFPSTGPAIAPGVHIDLIEAYDSIQKIRQMADILIPLHDLSIGKMKQIP